MRIAQGGQSRPLVSRGIGQENEEIVLEFFPDMMRLRPENRECIPHNLNDILDNAKIMSKRK